MLRRGRKEVATSMHDGRKEGARHTRQSKSGGESSSSSSSSSNAGDEEGRPSCARRIYSGIETQEQW